MVRVSTLTVIWRNKMETSFKQLSRGMWKMEQNRISWTGRKSSYWAIWSPFKLYMSRIMISESSNLKYCRIHLRIVMIKARIRMEAALMRRGSFLRCATAFSLIRLDWMDTLEECLVLKMYWCNLIIRLSFYLKTWSCSNLENITI
jgi:hypothetical protein